MDYRATVNKAYLIADNLLTSLGFDTHENLEALRQGRSGLRIYSDPAFSPVPFAASRVDDQRLASEFGRIASGENYTRFEQMVILSALDAITTGGIDASDPTTLFVLSTTKGNIDLLDRDDLSFGGDRIHLWKAARILSGFFHNPNEPLVVSNACISGIVAVIVAAGLIRTSRYKHIVITGGDMVTPFVVAGFQSFRAVSAEPCRPFDKKRDGLSLGEGCGTMILSSDPRHTVYENPVTVTAGASTNDANHISGPSRTGEGLFLAINKTLREAGIHPAEIDYISAHGTATVFNDEMESIAISRCGLESAPVNSVKGFLGHTLGAAGVIESVITARSTASDTLFASIGLEELGVSKPINIIKELRYSAIRRSLKLAAGFGGCNAAVLFTKDDPY